MSRVLLSLVVAALLACPAASRAVYGGPPIDPGALGQQVQAKLVDDFVLITRNQTQLVFETQTRTETRARVVEVDGEKREETFTVEVPVTLTKPVTVTIQQKLATHEAQAFDMQGKRVAADQLADALKEERTILLATRKVPRYYLTIYKPDTLLLVIKPQVMHGASAPFFGSAPLLAPGVAPPRIEAPRALPAPAVAPPGEAPPKPDTAPKPAIPIPGTLPVPAAPAALASAEPQVSMAHIVDDKFGLRRYVKDLSSETALREEEVDGVKKLVPVSIEVETITDVERKYPQNLVKIYRADKKPLAEDEIARLKDSERCVLVSSDGKEVDPKYLKIVRPEALIVVAPVAPQPHFAAPFVAPATLPLPVPMPPAP